MTKEFNLKTSINKGFYNYHKMKSTAASWSRERQDRIEVYFWRTRFLSGPWLNVLLIAGYRQLYCHCPDPSFPNAWTSYHYRIAVRYIMPFHKIWYFLQQASKNGGFSIIHFSEVIHAFGRMWDAFSRTLSLGQLSGNHLHNGSL